MLGFGGIMQWVVWYDVLGCEAQLVYAGMALLGFLTGYLVFGLLRFQAYWFKVIDRQGEASGLLQAGLAYAGFGLCRFGLYMNGTCFFWLWPLTGQA